MGAQKKTAAVNARGLRAESRSMVGWGRAEGLEQPFYPMACSHAPALRANSGSDLRSPPYVRGNARQSAQQPQRGCCAQGRMRAPKPQLATPFSSSPADCHTTRAALPVARIATSSRHPTSRGTRLRGTRIQHRGELLRETRSSQLSPARTLSAAEFFNLGQQLCRFSGAGWADRLGPQDLAVLTDQNRGSVGDACLIQPSAVGLSHGTLWVEVGQERELNAPKALGPGLVTELEIHGDTQNLGVSGLELRQKRVETGDFDASGRREVERIEDDENVLAARVGGECLLAIEMAVQLEIGG